MNNWHSIAAICVAAACTCPLVGGCNAADKPTDMSSRNSTGASDHLAAPKPTLLNPEKDGFRVEENLTSFSTKKPGDLKKDKYIGLRDLSGHMVALHTLEFEGGNLPEGVTINTKELGEILVDKEGYKLSEQQRSKANALLREAAQNEHPRTLDPKKDGFEIIFEVEIHLNNGPVFTGVCDPLQSRGLPALIGAKVKKAWIGAVRRGRVVKRFSLNYTPGESLRPSLLTKEFGEIELYDEQGDQSERLTDSQIWRIQQFLKSKLGA